MRRFAPSFAEACLDVTARLALGAVIFAAGCTHSQLRSAGDNMVRVERATQGVVDGVVAYKDVVKADCVEQNLQTEAERAKCVEKAVAVLRVSEPAVQGVKAALVSFWELYPVLEAKLVNKEKVTGADLADLAARAARVAAEYEALIKAVQEAKK
jgi:hypothetical protein